ncbi:hypothetical protein ACFX1T_022948 [Malus domestica]
MSEAYTENLEAPPPPVTKYQFIKVNAKGMKEGASGWKCLKMYAW